MRPGIFSPGAPRAIIRQEEVTRDNLDATATGVIQTVEPSPRFVHQRIDEFEISQSYHANSER